MNKVCITLHHTHLDSSGKNWTLKEECDYAASTNLNEPLPVGDRI